MWKLIKGNTIKLGDMLMFDRAESEGTHEVIEMGDYVFRTKGKYRERMGEEEVHFKKGNYFKRKAA